MLNDSVFVHLSSILGLHSHFIYANSEETGNCQGMYGCVIFYDIFIFLYELFNK